MTVFKRMWLMLFALCLASCAPAQAESGVRALFINVGKADAALFFLGDECYLIDTGTKDSFDQLKRVLDTYGVTHLSGVIVTHTDKDHSGGLNKLLKSGIEVDMLYASHLHSEPKLSKHRVYEASEKYGVPLTWLRSGDSIQAKDGSVFQILGPITRDPDKENNNSLVIRLVTAHGDMLLTGDMEFPEEQELMQHGLIAPAAVLKVPNHGESDATGRKFALTVQAQWAVISTNSIEEPDTPDPGVLSRLQEARSSIAFTENAEVGVMITLQDGTVFAQQIDWQ